jgi:hypothetical protein
MRLMLSFFLNKQQQNNPGKQDNSKRSLDNVKENEHTQVLDPKDLHNIEGGNSRQSTGMIKDRISLDDFFSGTVPQ